MKLFLMRHAQASETFPDHSRELSDFGRMSILQMCKNLDAKNFQGVAQIWHSPFTRAADTAKIFAQQMQISAPLKIVDSVRPDDNPYEIAHTIANLAVFESDLMLVTHNPFVETLSDILTGGNRKCAAIFKTCTLAEYTLQEYPHAANPYGVWSLDFLVSPSIFNINNY